MRDLLSKIERCAEFVRALLSQGGEIRQQARDKLQREGKLRRLGAIEPFADPADVEGVDGSLDIVHAAAVDFAVAAAVAVGRALRHRVEVISAAHSQFLSRACQGIMTMLELRLIAESQAPLIIYDGSLISALVRVNSALAAREEHPEDGLWRQVDPVFQSMSEVPAWFLESLNKRVIACPKLSASDSFLSAHFPGLKGIFSDRSFFTLVLEPGEFVAHKPPFPQTNLARTSRFIRDHPDRRRVEEFYDRDRFWEVFYRPHSWSAAYKLEVPGKFRFDPGADDLSPMLETFRGLLSDPSLQEPYPQFLADALCRQISVGVNALRDGVESLLCSQGIDISAIRSTMAGYRTRLPRHESGG